jgi:hypothetical protein
LRYYERAIAARPDYPDYYMDSGVALRDLGRLPEAIARCDKALTLKPDLHEARCRRAHARLLAGDYDRGWEDYRARWLGHDLGGVARKFNQPRWEGEDPDGRTVLIHAEQGLGDIIQFCRYVPHVKARGARTVLLIDDYWRPLAGLLRSLDGVDQLALDLSETGGFDMHCPLLDLPRLFGTRVETIPAAVPYLFVEPELASTWRRRLNQLQPPDGALRVGFLWAGNPLSPRNRLRSPGLAPLLPLIELPGTRWFSLQMGPGRQALESCVLPDSFTDLGPDLRHFADTAAAVSEMDLVISPCTACAHLSGALGQRTWVMLSAAPDWRWMLNREDSPWYPSARLFRQSVLGDWSDVVQRLGSALQEEI